MKLTELTQEQLDAAYIELCQARFFFASHASGIFEKYYLDRVALLDPVIEFLGEAAAMSGGGF